MYKCTKNKCCSPFKIHCLAFSAIIIGIATFTLCSKCKYKLSKKLSEAKDFMCDCKDDCISAYDNVKADIKDGLSSKDKQEADTFSDKK